jgi:protein gp37
MLGQVRLPFIPSLDWVICGGESGPNARPLQAEWVADLQDQCKTAGVPFFFKQWGGRELGCRIDGMEIKEFPQKVEARTTTPPGGQP